MPPAMVIVLAAAGAILAIPIVVTRVLLPKAITPAPAVPIPDMIFNVVLAADAPFAILIV